MSSSPATGPSGPPAPPLPVPTAMPERFQVHAYPPVLRALGAAEQLLVVGSLLFFTARFVLDTLQGEQTLQQGPFLLTLGMGVLLPQALVALLRRHTLAEVEVRDTGLALLLRSGASLELPYEAVESVRPWRLPLPGPGLTLRLRTGRGFGYGLEVEDAVPLLEALGRRGPLGDARTSTRVRYAQARHGLWRRRWYQVALKLAVFPLLPAAVLFRAHQLIAFGGAFGQYQMYGLAPYLRSLFVEHYLPVTLVFILCACAFRALAEAVCFAAAWLLPSYARGVRRGAEWLCRLAFFVGLTGLIGLRFL